MNPPAPGVPGSVRWLGLVTALLGAGAVVLAALGSHAVAFASDRAMRLWDIALLIHLVHAAALLAVVTLVRLDGRPRLAASGWMMAAGVVLFCGTLYGRAAGLAELPALVPPVGGFLLMGGWPLLGLILISKKTN